MPVDDLTRVVTTAQQLAVSPAGQEALAAMVAAVNADPALLEIKRNLAGGLATAPPSVAIQAIRVARLEEHLGKKAARCFYLMLALLQVPAARARHQARDIDAPVSQETLSDLAQWANRVHQQTGHAGLTLEILEWAQRYLRGELFQLGSLQFDLRPFAGSIRVFRNQGTRALAAVSLDGRRVDLVRGELTDDPLDLGGADWHLALEPGTPVLEMWISGNAIVTLKEIIANIAVAHRLFARLSPETIPRAVTGHSWRMDPQVAPFMPDESGILDLQRVCQLFPSTWSEGRTLRRLFGPEVDRAALAKLPVAAMDALQRGIAQLLAQPGTMLRARSAFALSEDIALLAEAR